MALGAQVRRAAFATGLQGSGESLRPAWWLGLPVVSAFALIAIAQAYPQAYARWVAGELGMLELAQLAVIVAALTLALGLLARPDVRRRRGLAAWVGLAAVGCFYTAGEEASWGQHLFGWRTPEEWRAINDQGETNLHNTSSWLDQKPRLLLELGVVAGGIVIPLLERVRPHLRRSPFAVIVPPMICLPSAVLAELSIGIERALGLAGIEFDEVLHFRPSELQELYFYLFVLFYLHALRQRLHPNRRASSVGS